MPVADHGCLATAGAAAAVCAYLMPGLVALFFTDTVWGAYLEFTDDWDNSQHRHHNYWLGGCDGCGGDFGDGEG